MDLQITEHIPSDFSENSRVWIYQSHRLFLINELLEMEDQLKEFVNDWNSHGIPVKGYASVFFGRFLVLMADEAQTGVSGCSTDSSVHMIKLLEKKYNTSFFNRQLLAFYKNGKVEQIPMSQLEYAFANKLITGESLFFDHTVSTKKELLEHWIRPVNESWLAKKLGI